MNKITLPQLKKQLKSYKQEELISIILDCYKSSADVKNYIHMLLEPEGTEEQLYEETKKKIRNQFYPDRGQPKLKLAEAKKAITEFGKLSSNEARLLDLMIYYVELGVEFTNDYGDMYDSYYSSMVSMFRNVMDRINTMSTYTLFQDRLKLILHNTQHIGWGFGDALADIFYTVALDFEDELKDEEEED
ncbi:DUF6155 family protein [Paenibacillus sp. MMO-177]|uniref:DUF6155 family protein n=1 Tax=Paenibacillus sp. MMO-177 TaxID=3081289 RepID=UPI00301851A6